jgi:hypothetical protein
MLTIDNKSAEGAAVLQARVELELFGGAAVGDVVGGHMSHDNIHNLPSVSSATQNPRISSNKTPSAQLVTIAH